MTDDSDDRSALEAHVASDVRALSAASDHIARAFAHQHDLGPNDFRALLQIMVSESGGHPSNPGELGQSLGLSSAAMTYLVERMINSGHIRREPDPRDRRKVVLRYDEPGMNVAREFFGPLGAHTREAMADLPDDDLAAAHRVFGALIGAMHTYQAELGSKRS